MLVGKGIVLCNAIASRIQGENKRLENEEESWHCLAKPILDPLAIGRVAGVNFLLPKDLRNLSSWKRIPPETRADQGFYVVAAFEKLVKGRISFVSYRDAKFYSDAVSFGGKKHINVESGFSSGNARLI